jgi:hypothetical protein
MSRKDIQQAVLAVLKAEHAPLSVPTLFEKVRARLGHSSGAVSDFDLHSALLAILAVGWATSNVTSQISASASDHAHAG